MPRPDLSLAVPEKRDGQGDIAAGSRYFEGVGVGLIETGIVRDDEVMAFAVGGDGRSLRRQPAERARSGVRAEYATGLVQMTGLVFEGYCTGVARRVTESES